MKQKQFLRGAFFALSVLALISLSCQFTEDPVEGQTEDGLVKITINTGAGGAGSSRSLTDATTRGLYDYVEAIFENGGNYYRAAGYRGQTITLSIPAGTYDDTNAVLLVGTYAEKTLLGIGTLTGQSITITPATTTISFDVQNLKHQVKSGLIFVTDPLTTVTIEDTPTSVYFGLLTDEDYEATLTIGFSGSGITKIKDLLKQPSSLNPSFKDLEVSSMGVRGSSNADAGVGLTGIKNETATLEPTGITLEFEFTVPLAALSGAAGGFSMVSLNAPVKALNYDPNDNKGAFTWYIRNGIENWKADTGTDYSTGGGILLAFGTVSGYTAGLIPVAITP